MHKLKTAMILLLTLGLSVLGILLPGITTQMVDSAGTDAVYAKEMTTPSATVPVDQRSPEEDIIYKLSILDRGRLVSVSSDVAIHEEGEIRKLSDQILQQFLSAGIIDQQITARRFSLNVAVDPNDPSSHFFVWVLSYSNTNQKKEIHSLEILLDDETETILAVSYSTTTPMDHVRDRMDRLSEMYITGLGLDSIMDVSGEEYHDTYAQNNFKFPVVEGVETEVILVVEPYYITTTFVQLLADTNAP